MELWKNIPISSDWNWHIKIFNAKTYFEKIKIMSLSNWHCDINKILCILFAAWFRLYHMDYIILLKLTCFERKWILVTLMTYHVINIFELSPKPFVFKICHYSRRSHVWIPNNCYYIASGNDISLPEILNYVEFKVIKFAKMEDSFFNSWAPILVFASSKHLFSRFTC